MTPDILNFDQLGRLIQTDQIRTRGYRNAGITISVYIKGGTCVATKSKIGNVTVETVRVCIMLIAIIQWYAIFNVHGSKHINCTLHWLRASCSHQIKEIPNIAHHVCHTSYHHNHHHNSYHHNHHHTSRHSFSFCLYPPDPDFYSSLHLSSSP